MERKVILDDVVPARYARAYEVKKGQVLRIYQVEGKQVGDCVFFNAHNYKEFFHVSSSWSLNVSLGTGTAYTFKHFYSNAPYVNVIFTTLEDTVKNHSGNMSGRCNRRSLELRGRGRQERSCDESLTEAMAPYGLKGHDIVEIFNVFMVSELNAEGTFTRKPPTAMKGDYIDLLAEMDVLAGISACPADNETNDFRPKPLGVKILE